jgi:hypothetical protein
LVDPLAVGECAWLVPAAGGLAFCVWVLDEEGGLVCAWFEGVAVWLAGGLVWAWLVDVPDPGAVVLVAVFGLDAWPVAVWPVEDGACVWAELVEGLVCADPEAELDDGADVEDDGVVVDVESCWRGVADGLELDELGEDCASADVAIATAAVVARNRRLFI